MRVAGHAEHTRGGLTVGEFELGFQGPDRPRDGQDFGVRHGAL
jgi:hypothetical protein